MNPEMFKAISELVGALTITAIGVYTFYNLHSLYRDFGKQVCSDITTFLKIGGDDK